MSTLKHWISKHKHYIYSGTIWGEYYGLMTQAEVIECLEALDHGDPELIEHPAVSGDTSAHGYYLESGDLHYRGPDHSDECVLLEVLQHTDYKYRLNIYEVIDGQDDWPMVGTVYANTPQECLDEANSSYDQDLYHWTNPIENEF